MEENTNVETQEQDTITISKSDYEKAIQSAEDKLRTKYSTDIKALNDKVTELTPKQKSDAELVFFARVNSSILQNKFPTPCLGKFAKRLGQ